jgi:hypothetical protein
MAAVTGVKRAPLHRRTPLRSRRGASASWRRARQATESRAGGRCEVDAPGCTRRGVHAHHVIMRSHGGPDDPSNLVWVCAHCHDRIHGNPAWAYAAGWLRRAA